MVEGRLSISDWAHHRGIQIRYKGEGLQIGVQKHVRGDVSETTVGFYFS
jgi:hypothetical protein